MTAPALKEALGVVETLGLAPMARIEAARPKNYMSDAWRQWNLRASEVAQGVTTRLREAGVYVDPRSDGARVRFAGVTGSSTLGLHQALRNWKADAEKRLKGARR